MANTELKTRILLRNDAKDNWDAVKDSVVLGKGEIGIEYTPSAAAGEANDLTKAEFRFKIGNGTSMWKDLPYYQEKIQKDITATYAFGKYAPDSTGSVTIPAKGQTLEQFLQSALAQELQPDVTQPSASFSTYTGKDLGNHEPGESLSGNFSYVLAFNSGSYQYGPSPTGATAESFSLTYSTYDLESGVNKSVTKTLTTASGTIPYTLIVGNSNLQIKVTAASIAHTAGSTPKTNLGNNADSSKIIAAGTKSAGTKSNTIISSRKTFYGSDAFTGTENIENSVTMTNNIRSLAGKDWGESKKLTVKSKNNHKRIVVAIPGTHTLTSVIDVEGMGLDVKSNFKTLTAQIGGADASSSSVGNYATDYTIFVWEDPATIAAHTYNFTIN